MGTAITLLGVAVIITNATIFFEHRRINKLEDQMSTALITIVAMIMGDKKQKKSTKKEK